MRALVPMYVPISNGSHLSNVEVRDRFRVSGFEPIDTPTQSGQPDYEEQLRSFFCAKAENIFRHIPSRNDEERERIERAKKFIIFASTHTETGTDFMVVRETNGLMLLRLYHHRLELLQEGAERILETLGAARLPPRAGVLSVAREIEVYEHGLATPTIRGIVVDNRTRYAWRHSAKDFCFLAGSILFEVITLVLDHFDVFSAYPRIADHAGRFVTAMVTTSLVSLYSIVHMMWSATPPIEWSLHYEDNRP